MTEPTSQTNTIAYGVWIRGRGWLRDDKGQIFADHARELADGAVHLWGRGARVIPFDDAMLALEATFLGHEPKPMWVRAWTWLKGRLGKA